MADSKRGGFGNDDDDDDLCNEMMTGEINNFPKH